MLNGLARLTRLRMGKRSVKARWSSRRAAASLRTAGWQELSSVLPWDPLHPGFPAALTPYLSASLQMVSYLTELSPDLQSNLLFVCHWNIVRL